jgi:noranthrone synthase
LRGVPRGMFRVILAAADAQNPKGSKKGQEKQQLTASLRKQNAPEDPVVRQALSAKAIPVPVPVPPPNLSSKQLKGPELVSQPEKTKLTQKNDQITPALNIISEESGIATADLTDDSVFSDIGVDSLLSMVIASRFREEIGIDLDIDFSLFVDLPTVKDLKDFLEPFPSSEAGDAPIVSQVEVQDTVTTQAGAVDKTPVSNPTTAIASKTADLIASAMEVVSEESGIAISELTDDCVFSEIGVDSLLSMVIASRFREELGLDLDIEFSIFMDLPTVKDLKKFLGSEESGGSVQPSDENQARDDQSSGTLYGSGLTTPDNVISLSDSSEASTPNFDAGARPSSYCRPATSVILQNFPKIAARTLIMLPDGGGSSSSYVPIPRLNIDVAIIGLNCPYARDAWNMKCNYNDLLDSYMAEIRRRQPKGPYNLGGWSSGGVMAYMVAYRLLKEGEQVDHLIIIDSPVPETMDRLPVGFYEFCEKLGLYGGSTGTDVPAPEWLIPHFLATVDVLEDYRADPLRGIKKIPKVSIIWACDSVLDEKNKPPPELLNSKGSHFLLKARQDFGPCGWETLIPGAEIMMERVVGGNHFSMMVCFCCLPRALTLCRKMLKS